MEASLFVRQDAVTLQAYPYEAFWHPAVDPTYQVPYDKFDASAYAGTARKAVEKNFRTIVVENEYLALTFLPDLGGRLYQVVYKPTGQRLFYNNPVLKPTPWGNPQQGGWVAAGGMEWALPVNEHGYEWGIPWSYTIDQEPDHVTVTLEDSRAPGRVRALIAVTLPAHAAYFTVHPRITNGTDRAVPIQFWINAMLSLDAKTVSPETEFILRGAQVFIHSTGNDFVPAANVPPADAQGPENPLPWPVIGGRDLARYRNWKDYLGVFLTGSGSDFAGAYNHSNDLGIARVFPRDRVLGVKLFAFGPNFGGRSLFGDDNSDYFELWGGLPLTFWGYQEWPFAPGETREWDEDWIPLSRTGGVRGAAREIILNVSRDHAPFATVTAAATRPGTRGTLVLSRNELELKRWTLSLDPGTVFRAEVDVGSAEALKLQFLTVDGKWLAEATN